MNLLGCDVPPEFFGVLFGAAIEVEVTFHAFYVRMTDKLFTGGINFGLAHEFGFYQVSRMI
jgi:hypothetical protein